MNKKILKYGGIALIVLLVIYFMPFITVELQTAQKNIYRVPFAVHFLSDDGEFINFNSLRSGYALHKDAKNALYSYGEKKCYGKKYYYDEKNDISYDGIEIKNGLMNTLRYHYVIGNACSGWTLDDEVAWPFAKIEEVDDTMDKEEILLKNWLLIENGKAKNINIYNDFSRLVKQNVLCYIRVVIDNTKSKLIDIQLLSDGKFKVITKDKTGVQEEIYSRISEFQREDGTKDICAYKGYGVEEARILFQLN